MFPVPCPQCNELALVVHVDDVECPFSCSNCGHEMHPDPDEVPRLLEFLANWALARVFVGETVEFCGHTVELQQEQGDLRLVVDGEVTAAEEECSNNLDTIRELFENLRNRTLVVDDVALVVRGAAGNAETNLLI